MKRKAFKLGVIVGLVALMVCAMAVPIVATSVTRVENKPSDYTTFPNEVVLPTAGDATADLFTFSSTYWSLHTDFYDYSTGSLWLDFGSGHSQTQVGMWLTINTPQDSGVVISPAFRLKRDGDPGYVYLYCEDDAQNGYQFVTGNGYSRKTSNTISTLDAGTLLVFDSICLYNGTYKFYLEVASSNVSNYVSLGYNNATSTNNELTYYDGEAWADDATKKVRGVLHQGYTDYAVAQSFNWATEALLTEAYIYANPTAIDLADKDYMICITEQSNGKPNMWDGILGWVHVNEYPGSLEFVDCASADGVKPQGGTVGQDAWLDNGILLPAGNYFLVIYSDSGFSPLATMPGLELGYMRPAEPADRYASGEMMVGFGNDWEYTWFTDAQWGGSQNNDLMFRLCYDTVLTTVPDPTITYTPTTSTTTTTTTAVPTTTTTGPGGGLPTNIPGLPDGFFSSVAGHWLLVIAGIAIAFFSTRQKPVWGVVFSVLILAMAIVTGFIDGWILVLLGIGVAIWVVKLITHKG